MEMREALSILQFFREAERLKNVYRSAWTSDGQPESSASHTWRLCLIALTMERYFPTVDIGRLLKICIVHDLGEAIHGDIPAIYQQPDAPKAEQERNDLLVLLGPLPEPIRHDLLALWDEYEAAASPEARIAKALDKLETLLQHNQGANPPDFDYEFNLEYGKKFTDQVPLIAALRRTIDAETKQKAAAAAALRQGSPAVGPSLGLLHTAPVHVATFDDLAATLAPEVALVHEVAEELLAEARLHGVQPALRAAVQAAIRRLAEAGAGAVLCTCSTIGDLAETEGRLVGVTVLRVDRAMATRAVQLGRRIVVVVALESTIPPTLALLQEEATRARRAVELLPSPCTAAWEAFEAGDLAGYRRQIVAHVRAVAHQGDVVVLAQASMAPAVADLADLPLPVLSSPQLGLNAALALLAPG